MRNFLIVLIVWAYAGAAFAGTLSGLVDFVDGEVISATDTNANNASVEDAVTDNANDIVALEAVSSQPLSAALTDLAAGDFSAAASLEANGSLSAGALDALNELGDICAGTEILQRNAGDTAWECIATPSGGSGATTDAGTVTHVTSATDDFAVGGTDSSAAFFVDEDTGNVSCNVAGCGFSGTTAASTGDSIQLNEGTGNGSNYQAIKAPDTITATDDVVYILPDDEAPNAAHVLGIASVSGTAPVIITLEWEADDSSGGLTTNVSGTSALGTSAITANSCATTVTTSATGVATTDAITWTPNADIESVNGYGVGASGDGLVIYAWPTANNVNFKVCNATGSSITPGAVTLNWRVVN